MKKLLLYLVFFSIFTIAWPHVKADSSRAKLEASATISLNSNGIAYIPAFSLDKPAIIGTLTLAKNRFSYDPVLSYGLFIATKISSSLRNVPFSILFQAIQALDSNISPFPEFKWNLGLAYTL